MDILQIRELKQSLERRDARILELERKLEAARQPERGEAVAWLRKNGFRFNGDIEPQDDSELPLYTHPDSGRVAELEARLAASREREVKLIADLDANLEAFSDERKRALSAESLARELHELLADYVSQDSIAQGYGAGIGGTTYEKAEALLSALAAEKEEK